jgi:hypothetical protein
MHKLILIVLLVTWSNLSQAQYSTEFVDVYKMDSNDKMQKMGTKKFPMDITINGKNIFMFDKTSCFEPQHQCQSRATSTHIQSFGIRAA